MCFSPHYYYTPIMNTVDMIKPAPSGVLKEKTDAKQDRGLHNYYITKIQKLTIKKKEKQHNWKRLRVQRNELNMRGIICVCCCSTPHTILTIIL
jgi:hypothetical protein